MISDISKVMTVLGICAGALITITYDTAQVTWKPLVERLGVGLSDDIVFMKVFSAILAILLGYAFIRYVFYLASKADEKEHARREIRSQVGTLDKYLKDSAAS